MAESTAARELGILFPDIDLVLPSGLPVTVREIRFRQAIDLGQAVRPLARALAEGCVTGELTKDNVHRIWSIKEDYPDEFFKVLAVSTGWTVEKLGALSEDDGEALEVAFWSVNTAFFARRVRNGLRAIMADKERPSGGSMSSPDSPKETTTQSG